MVTDVGAQLSHAAIVDRELGIAAVVGCGSTTARLRSGDHVWVDGGLARSRSAVLLPFFRLGGILRMVRVSAFRRFRIRVWFKGFTPHSAVCRIV